MKNIVLTGFMGTGKSTVGKLVAKKMGRRFIDTDKEIEKRENKSIAEIFEKEGEEYFRNVESNVIAEISNLSGCVIATGGGVVLNKKNIDNLRRNGIIVNLSAGIREIAGRTQNKKGRPLIDNKSIKQIKDMMESRKKFYEDNDFSVSVEGQSPLLLASKIISIYKNLT